MVDQLDQLTSAVGAAVGAETPTLQHDENAQPFVDSPLASGDALEPNMWALRWAHYGTDPETDWRFWLNKARCDKMKVLTVVYTAAAGRVATLMQNGQAWHGAAAACFATLAYAYLARRTRICITTAGCVALGCIILRSWQVRHQLYRYLHDVYQDACNVMSLADFLVISAEASSAFVHALFAGGSDEGQGGTAHGPEEQHTEATTVDGYHAPIWRQIWRNFDNLQPKKIYKILKTVFQPALKEDKTKHGRNLLLDTSTSVDLETHGRNETADVTHPCNDGAISIGSWQKREDHQVHRLPDDARARQRMESAPLGTTSTYIDCASRGQADRTKPNRVDQETRRNLTARDVRIKRFDEHVDRINPMSVVELDPWGHSQRNRPAAAALAFTKSYEAVHRQSARATRPHQRRPRGAFSAGKRDGPPDPVQLTHVRDTAKIRERVTKRSRSSWFKCYKIRKSNATSEKMAHT